MTKQEQIHEMMLNVPQIIVAYDANPKGQHLYGEQRQEIAEELYNAGYRKHPEDSVVLSSEEYEKLKSLYDTQKGAIMTSEIGDLPLTVAGLRKAVDEITRLNNVEAELQELNMKYYNEAKDLRRQAKDLRRQLADIEAENKRLLKLIDEE